jgi:heme o synthase
MFNIAWYNGIYTYLKRATAFAVIPGALTGAIPVMMGWTAAGGVLGDPVILFITSFIFLWQVPHFWLLLMLHGDEYKKAGFPVLFDLFGDRQVRSLTFAWLITSVLASLLLLRFRIISSMIPVLLVMMMDLFLTGLSLYTLFFSPGRRVRLLFITLNVVMLVTLLLAALDRLV